MKEPLYRWVCTMCGISDEAENSEMARINIDVHVQVAHPLARKVVKVQPDTAGDLVVLGDEHDGGGAADGTDGRVRP